MSQTTTDQDNATSAAPQASTTSTITQSTAPTTTAPTTTAPTTTTTIPPTDADWARAALAVLGVRTTAAANAQPAAARQLATPQPSGNAVAPPVGSGRSKHPLGAWLSKSLFGKDAARRGVLVGQEEIDKSQKFKRRREEQYANNTAAKVSINSHGRVLDGNFFTAGNKPLANDQPDLTRPVVLFLSGMGGTAEDQGTETAQFYQDSGASTLAVNYGGYGGSTGMDETPSEQTLLEDAQSMLQRLLDLGYTPDQIIIHGFSMGGGIAGILQTHNEKEGRPPFRGLVLDRPMISSTAGVKGQEGSGPVGVLGAAMTRAAVGRMDARAAIEASGSTTRMVITSDEGDFASYANKFRNKLSGKGNRSVEGEQTGKDHMDTGAMVEKNAAYLRALIDIPRAGATDPTQAQDTRSEQEKMVTGGIKDRLTRRLTTIEKEGDVVADAVGKAVSLASDPANPLSAPEKTDYITNYRGYATRIEATLDELDELANAGHGLLSSGDRGKAEQRREKMLGTLKTINENISSCGGQPAYSDRAKRMILAPVRTAKTNYDTFPPQQRDGYRPVEKNLLAHSDLVQHLIACGGLSGQDLADVQAVGVEIAAIQGRQNAAPQPVNPGTAPATTSKGLGRLRRKAAAFLRRGA